MPKKQSHSSDQIKAFLAELNTQTDRGAAIIAAAVLDDLLELLLVERFIKLGSERFDGLFKKMGAPLSSFSAKIEINYAIGTISNDARLAIHLIRDIRNKFAHRMEQISFDHPDVATEIQSRMSPHLKKLKRPNRQNFLDTFSAVAMTLYGTLGIDIRIKPLEETHRVHFVQFALMVADLLKEPEVPKA